MTCNSMTNINLRSFYRDFFYADPAQTDTDQRYLAEVLQKILPWHLYATISLKYGFDGKCINDDVSIAKELGLRTNTIKKHQKQVSEILIREEVISILFATKGKARSEVDDLRSYALKIQAELFRRSESMMKRFSLAGTLPPSMNHLRDSIEERIRDIDGRIINVANIFTELLIHEPQRLAATYMLIIRDCESTILDVEKVEDYAIRKTARMLEKKARFYDVPSNGFRIPIRNDDDD